MNVVSAGFSEPEAAGEGGGSQRDGEFEPLTTSRSYVRGSSSSSDSWSVCVCSGPGDPDGAGFTRLCQNQDVSPVRGSEEETGHRSGAR